ncbi:hypothetical protein JHD50_08810 [Sulfurimonas sp. MAG313]|nr:hypothetical protein [Sulfurimonas sp. MAG313]MDF1881397.1 hypothetical protein [Sulfurimonas sp. MAG313]
MPENNSFEERLTQMASEVKTCQKNYGLTTCMTCESLIGCELRKQYVQVTYESMSKGEIGGFEF